LSLNSERVPAIGSAHEVRPPHSAAIIPEISVPLDSPESVRAARAILGLKPQDTRSTIAKRYRRLAKKANPDAGGNAERFRAIKEAYKLIVRNMPTPVVPPKRGRPSKHFKPPVPGRWFVVVTNATQRVRRAGKTVTEKITIVARGKNGHEDHGYATRAEAEAKLDELRFLAQDCHPAPISTSAEIQPVRDVKTKRAPHYDIAGPSERVRAHRKSKKSGAAGAEKARLEEIHKIVSHTGEYSDTHGTLPGEVSGGRDANKIEHISAAHEATKGGPFAVARRSRGGGFRSYNMIGNGPDSFDSPDESADSADHDHNFSDQKHDNVSWLEFNYLPAVNQASVNAIMRQHPEAEEWRVLAYLNGGISATSERVDSLAGASVEDRALPPVAGFDQYKLEYTAEDYRKAEKFDETEGSEDETAPFEDIEVEQLTLYTGQEGFPEFPEMEGDDFSDVLTIVYPEPKAEAPAPAIAEIKRPALVPAKPVRAITDCNENAEPKTPKRLAG
jgi:DnaJ-like protein